MPTLFMPITPKTVYVAECPCCNWRKEFGANDIAQRHLNDHIIEHGFEDYWKTKECGLTNGFYNPMKDAYIEGFRKGYKSGKC